MSRLLENVRDLSPALAFSPGQGTVANGASYNPRNPAGIRSRRTRLEGIKPTTPYRGNLTTQSPPPGVKLRVGRRIVPPHTAKPFAIPSGRTSQQDLLANAEEGPRRIS